MGKNFWEVQEGIIGKFLSILGLSLFARLLHEDSIQDIEVVGISQFCFNEHSKSCEIHENFKFFTQESKASAGQYILYCPAARTISRYCLGTRAISSIPWKVVFSYLLIHYITGYSEFTLLIDIDDFKCSSNGLNQY